MFRISKPDSLQDYWFLSITIDRYRFLLIDSDPYIIQFSATLTSIDFWCQSLIIGRLYQLRIDFWYRFLSIKRPTIWLLRGGGYGLFQRKISCRLISREKKILQVNTWRKNIHLSGRIMLKKPYTAVCLEIIILTEVWEKKNSYPNQIAHTPLPIKGQMVAP